MKHDKMNSTVYLHFSASTMQSQDRYITFDKRKQKRYIHQSLVLIMLAERREGWSPLPIFNLSAFQIRTEVPMYMYTSINTNAPNSMKQKKTDLGKKSKKEGGVIKKVFISWPCLHPIYVLYPDFYSLFSGISADVNWIRFPHRSGVLPIKHPRTYPMYAPVIIVMGYACHGRSLDVMTT